MQRTCGWGVWHTLKNYWRWDLSKTVSASPCHGKTTELYYITVVPAGPADIYIYCSCFHFPPNGDVDTVLDRSQRQRLFKVCQTPCKNVRCMCLPGYYSNLKDTCSVHVSGAFVVCTPLQGARNDVYMMFTVRGSASRFASHLLCQMFWKK